MVKYQTSLRTRSNTVEFSITITGALVEDDGVTENAHGRLRPLGLSPHIVATLCGLLHGDPANEQSLAALAQAAFDAGRDIESPYRAYLG